MLPCYRSRGLGPGTDGLTVSVVRHRWLNHLGRRGPDPLTRPGRGLRKRRLPRKQRRKPSTDQASNLLETTIPTMYLLESCLPSPVAAQVPSFWLCGLHFGPSFWLSGPSILAFWVFTLGFWAFRSQGSTALPGSSLGNEGFNGQNEDPKDQNVRNEAPKGQNEGAKPQIFEKEKLQNLKGKLQFWARSWPGGPFGPLKRPK